jgi:short-subunit dehydrogenase
MRIDSRAAVITGASSGIGAELARGLAAAGVPVGLVARREDRLRAVAARIAASGGTAVVATADVAEPSQVREAIAALADRLGPIDLLVANAGVGFETPARAFVAADFERLVRVNLLGASYAFEAVLPAMLARGRGHLVGISSLAAYRGLPGSAGYSATKAGLSALLEGFRVELRPRGIAVTTVHPGYVRTPMTEGAGHPLPFAMDVGPASRIILRGIAARRREVNFPWPMAAFLGLVRHWPNGLYDRVAAALEARARPDGGG